jgi:hypothetical protein
VSLPSSLDLPNRYFRQALPVYSLMASGKLCALLVVPLRMAFDLSRYGPNTLDLYLIPQARVLRFPPQDHKQFNTTSIMMPATTMESLIERMLGLASLFCGEDRIRRVLYTVFLGLCI